MRKLLAIAVCKTLRVLGKLLGKGSSLPGKYALKICPDILSRVQLPACVIAVSGSNGKTSTVEMVAAMLRAAGKTVVYNKEGSNQTEGVTTLVLGCATWGGKVKADVLLLESDERYAAHTFRHFHPTHFLITNLYRDQLTRNGHPESVFDALKQAVFPDTKLILNADDPLVSAFGNGRGNAVWFGLNRTDFATEAPQGVYQDGNRCPVCKGAMAYDYYIDHHLGQYHCSSCGHYRRKTDYAVTHLDLENGAMTINDRVTVELSFQSLYHVYNTLAAFALCCTCGVEESVAAGVANQYLLQNGRMKQFRLGKHSGTLLTAKHENSVAYDTNLHYVRDRQENCSVILIVDAVSRKYFCGDTSWLWDIDFDSLNVPHIEKVYLCGRHIHDLALRFSYTQLPEEKLVLCEDIVQVAERLKTEGEEPLYVVTCFSDRDKLLSQTEVL